MSKNFDSKIAEKALGLAIQTCGPYKWARSLEIASIYYDFLNGKTLAPKAGKIERILNWFKVKLTKKAE